MNDDLLKGTNKNPSNRSLRAICSIESNSGDEEMNVKESYCGCFAALLMFGMNGIVASYIALSSYEVVFTRTLIGSLLLIAIYALTRQKVHLFQNLKHMLCLIISSIAMGTSWMFLYEAYQRIGVSIPSLAYY
jgi:drug/metabolite transporter (DMT)-like permease